MKYYMGLKLMKGTVPQNMFSLKKGHIGCKDLSKDNGFKKNC